MITVDSMLIEWLESRVTNGCPAIATHEFDDARHYMNRKYKRMHTTATIERAWRKLREEKQIKTLDASILGSKEERWWIVKINTLKSQ